MVSYCIVSSKISILHLNLFALLRDQTPAQSVPMKQTRLVPAGVAGSSDLIAASHEAFAFGSLTSTYVYDVSNLSLTQISNAHEVRYTHVPARSPTHSLASN